jgi:hypothetical protein
MIRLFCFLSLLVAFLHIGDVIIYAEGVALRV